MINKIISTTLGFILVVFIILTIVPLVILSILEHYSKNRKPQKLLEIIKGVNYYLYNKILALRKKGEGKKKTIVSLIDPRANEIKDLQDFIKSERRLLPDHNIVVYYDPYFAPLINQYIQKHKVEIELGLIKKKLDFLYIGDLDTIDAEEASEIISYYFPQLNTTKLINSSVTEIKETLLKNNIIGNIFNNDLLNRPCFIRLKSWDDNEYCYSVYYLPEKGIKDIEDAISHYLWIVTPPIDINKPLTSHSMQLRLSVEEEVDKVSFEPPIEVSSSFKKELEKFLIKNGKAQTIKSMFALIEKVAPERLGFEGKILSLIKDLHKKIQPKISELIISPVGGIYLKEYNIEIKLTPLQKTVYLFFLSKPKGIYFKDLPEYKNELLEIYSRVSSRSDLESLRSSIEELANPYSNSMSEKCSRIKEAFLKQIDDGWAQYYYISGERNEEKVIKLDRSMVKFEESNF
jgi:hypothetical protein